MLFLLGRLNLPPAIAWVSLSPVGFAILTTDGRSEDGRLSTSKGLELRALREVGASSTLLLPSFQLHGYDTALNLPASPIHEALPPATFSIFLIRQPVLGPSDGVFQKFTCLPAQWISNFITYWSSEPRRNGDGRCPGSNTQKVIEINPPLVPLSHR